ncbi:MAG: quinone-dependent dihydroorotate dehydrogenase [Verrucomicrobiota bacterium]
MPDLYPLARKILFSLEAEKAHHLTLSMMQSADRLGMLKLLTGGSSSGSATHEEAGVEVMGLRFPNRIGLAAGMDKAGKAVSAFGSIGFGHVEIGTVTPRPQPGNPQPRLFRLKEHDAVINRMGFNNPGVEGLLENLEKSRRGFSGIIGINIGKNFDTPNEQFIDDYLACFEGVYGAADYVTANLSSPNTKGLRDLQSAESCRQLIAQLQEKRDDLAPQHDGKQVPIVIKIAPDLSKDTVKSLAETFSEAKVDGVLATNTTIARDAVSNHPLAVEVGGLSGTPLREKSNEILSLLRAELDPSIPIIGSGGVMTPDDVMAKLAAGAALVQIYTGLIYRGPQLVRESMDL